MKAGRELDALVATKVLGWHERIDVDYKPMQIEWYERDRFQAYVNCNTQLQSLNMFCPSKSIADAWRVVEKLGNWHGCTFLVVLQTPQERIPVGAIFEAGWYEMNYDGYESRATAQSDTAPLAICLAALKAVQL